MIYLFTFISSPFSECCELLGLRAVIIVINSLMVFAPRLAYTYLCFSFLIRCQLDYIAWNELEG